MSQLTNLVDAANGRDPEEGLRAVSKLRALVDRLEARHVGAARRAGWSWDEIARELGVTKQAVHKKHS